MMRVVVEVVVAVVVVLYACVRLYIIYTDARIYNYIMYKPIGITIVACIHVCINLLVLLRAYMCV